MASCDPVLQKNSNIIAEQLKSLNQVPQEEEDNSFYTFIENEIEPFAKVRFGENDPICDVDSLVDYVESPPRAEVLPEKPSESDDESLENSPLPDEIHSNGTLSPTKSYSLLQASDKNIDRKSEFAIDLKKNCQETWEKLGKQNRSIPVKNVSYCLKEDISPPKSIKSVYEGGSPIDQTANRKEKELTPIVHATFGEQ